MASVVELRTSRIGGTQGIDGATIPGEFLVTIDAAGDSPIVILRNFQPLNTWAPWGFGSRASNYRVIERLTALHWICGVDFSPPKDATLFAVSNSDPVVSGWKMSLRIHGETLQTTQTAPTNLDGSAAVAKIIGPNIYNDRDENTPGNELLFVIVDCDGKTKELWKSPCRIPSSQQIDRPAATITLTRDMPRMTYNVMGLATFMSKKVNRTRFLGAEPGHLKLDAGSIDGFFGEAASITRPSGGKATGPDPKSAATPMVTWTISLSFNWSSIGFTPLRMVHTRRDSETGAEAVVKSAAEPNGVIEEFPLIESVNFGSLFESIAAL